MPYTTERTVKTYEGHNTPPEYATDADEARAAFNDARDAAFADAEALLGVLDGLYDRADAGKLEAMETLAGRISGVLADARRLAD